MKRPISILFLMRFIKPPGLLKTAVDPFNPYLIQVKVTEYDLPGDYNHNGTVDAADYTV